jgi:uncharacterized membrane protein
MHWGIGLTEINPELDMELLLLVFVIIGTLVVIASGVWVAITLITGNRHEK